MMWGWLRLPAVRASRLKRSIMPSPVSKAGDITLMATLPCSPDTSEPHFGQKRVPGAIGVPQRAQLADEVVMKGVSRKGEYSAKSALAQRCRSHPREQFGGGTELRLLPDDHQHVA